MNWKWKIGDVKWKHSYCYDLIIYLIICLFPLNLLMDLFLFYIWIPLLIICVTSCDSILILTWSMDNPWIFSLSAIPYTLLISVNSYAYFFHSPISHPLSIQLGLYCTSIMMAIHRPHSFNSHILCLVSILYFILLCHVYCRLYVHSCKL